ncbi:MAG: hypothetical protein PHD82_15635 [Candidatus Riflebacteria bacterium]|nr:hypothetical protein [Candidatus Riflebacteria bacterium]
MPPSWLTRHKSFLLKYFFFRVGSELAFAFGKPSLRSSQAYEKDHGNHNPVLPWHKRRPGAIILSSICAW